MGRLREPIRRRHILERDDEQGAVYFQAKARRFVRGGFLGRLENPGPLHRGLQRTVQALVPSHEASASGCPAAVEARHSTRWKGQRRTMNDHSLSWSCTMANRYVTVARTYLGWRLAGA